MNVHFIEATQAEFNLNHGKFMLARFTPEEARAKSALPGYEQESLWRIGGLRNMRPGMTLVLDLQTGEGAAFTLVDRHGDPDHTARYDLAKHKIWVCPMFEPFLGWLYGQTQLGESETAIQALPRYVEIPTLEGDLAGYRRPGFAD